MSSACAILPTAGSIGKNLHQSSSLIGRRLKGDFENGRHYYEMQGKEISIPSNPGQRPSQAALEWHQSVKFLG
jgi:hypothetical protein